MDSGIKSKKSELEMLQNTYKSVSGNKNAKEDALEFLSNQIDILKAEIDSIELGGLKQSRDSNLSDMCSKINSPINEFYKDDKPKHRIKKHKRKNKFKSANVTTNSPFAVLKNSEFSVIVCGISLGTNQIKSFLAPLSAFKEGCLKIYDYVEKTPQNEIISSEKTLYDAFKNRTLFSIEVISIFPNNVSKVVKYNNCLINEIVSTDYDTTNDEIREFEVHFTYETSNMEVFNLDENCK